MSEKCIDCGADIPNIKVPAEIASVSGSLLCDKCAREQGYPTAKDLGLGV